MSSNKHHIVAENDKFLVVEHLGQVEIWNSKGSELFAIVPDNNINIDDIKSLINSSVLASQLAYSKMRQILGFS